MKNKAKTFTVRQKILTETEEILCCELTLVNEDNIRVLVHVSKEEFESVKPGDTFTLKKD